MQAIKSITVVFIVINTAFSIGFFSKYNRLRKQIKRKSYSERVFRKIDEDNRYEFFKLFILAVLNTLVFITNLIAD